MNFELYFRQSPGFRILLSLKTIRDYIIEHSLTFYFMGLMAIVKLLYNYFGVSMSGIFTPTVVAIILSLIALAATIYLCLALIEERSGRRPSLFKGKNFFRMFLIISAAIIYYGLYIILLLSTRSWDLFFIFFGAMIVRSIFNSYMQSRKKLRLEQ